MLARRVEHIAPKAIKNTARSNHVSVCFRMIENAGRIRQMQVVWREAKFLKDRDSLVESMHLTAGQRFTAMIVGRSEMRHQPIEPDVFKRAEFLCELARFI